MKQYNKVAYTNHNHRNWEVRPELEISPERFGKVGVLIDSPPVDELRVRLVHCFRVHINPEIFLKVVLYQCRPFFKGYFTGNSCKKMKLKAHIIQREKLLNTSRCSNKYEREINIANSIMAYEILLTVLEGRYSIVWVDFLSW